MKIEIRADCLVCGKEITNLRFRTYCSTKCRTLRNNKKYEVRQEAWRTMNQDRINLQHRQKRKRFNEYLESIFEKQHGVITDDVEITFRWWKENLTPKELKEIRFNFNKTII